jgi:hypothetical protein
MMDRKWDGLASLTVMGGALLAMGCDSDPPVDNGQFFRCSADIVVDTYDYLIFHDSTTEFKANFSICANPGTSSSDVLEECKDECDDYYEGINEVFVGVQCRPGAEITECEPDGGGQDIALTYASASCNDVQNHGSAGGRCDEGDTLYNIENFGQTTSSLVSGSSAELEIEGESGGTSASGQVSWSVSPDPRLGLGCPAQGCTFEINSMNLAGAAFEIEDVPIDSLVVNARRIRGRWTPDGRVVIPRAAFSVQSNFRVDGKSGSKRLAPEADVEGTADPVSGVFQFAGIRFSSDDFSARLTMIGETAGAPPEALITNRPSTVECNAHRSATSVAVEGAGFDPNGDVHSLIWLNVAADAQVTRVGTGSSSTLELPLGKNTVNLYALDRRGGLGVDYRGFEVVDTTPPTLTAGSAVIDVCSAEPGFVPLAAPTLADICTPDALSVEGAVITAQGQPVVPPIAVTSGGATLEPGRYVVRWRATDAAGNHADLDQTIDIVARPTLQANATLVLNDRSRVTLGASGFGSLANSGSVQTQLGVEAASGDVLSQAAVELRDRSRINGFVRTAGSLQLGTDALVTGPVFQGTPVTAQPVFPTLPSIVPGTTHIDIQPDQVQQLSPGAYGNVSVKSRGTLVLSTGTYSFASLQVESQAVVQRSAAVTLLVASNLIYRGSFSGTGLVTLGYGGTADTSLEAPFDGEVIAPNALLRVGTAGSGQVFNGTFAARSLEVRPDVTVRHVAASCQGPELRE